MKPNFKINNLLIAGCFLVAISFTSCIKDWRDGETDFSGTQPSVLIPEGGLTSNAFSAAALSFPGTDASDTVSFHVNYAAKTTAPTDETITLGVDQQALSDYNSTSSIQYELMPDSLYTFTATQVTVKAGNNYSDAIPFILHPDKIDPSQNYMLPISITDGPNGAIISGNQKTIYYHVIGNPYAGTYSDVGYFYHPAAPRDIAPNTKIMSAVTSQVLQVDLGDLGGSGYIAWLEVDPTTNAVTILNYDSENYYGDPNFLLQWSSLPSPYTPAWSGSSQCNNTYDPATKTFYLRYGYNGAGGYRVSEEILTKK